MRLADTLPILGGIATRRFPRMADVFDGSAEP
jgi:hypothetical protein